jgi:hypothetical protein
MTEDEHRHVIGRIVSPPPLPGVVGPCTADGAEHIAAQNPCAHVLHGAPRKVVVDSGGAVRSAAHGLERAGRNEPIVQCLASDSERTVPVLAGPAPYPSMETAKHCTRSLLMTISYHERLYRERFAPPRSRTSPGGTVGRWTAAGPPGGALGTGDSGENGTLTRGRRHWPADQNQFLAHDAMHRGVARRCSRARGSAVGCRSYQESACERLPSCREG